jgi:hypothetical protein
MGFLSKILSALASAAEPASPSDDAEPLQVSEFEKIVNDVAAGIYQIVRVSCSGPGKATLEFRSRSGKQTWPAFFDFDEQTGDFTCTAPYTASGALRRFGSEVSDRIRSPRASLSAPPAPDVRRFPRHPQGAAPGGTLRPATAPAPNAEP